jgi:hypothetical protein
MRLEEPTQGLKSGLVVVDTEDSWHDLRFYPRIRSSISHGRGYSDTETVLLVSSAMAG